MGDCGGFGGEGNGDVVGMGSLSLSLSLSPSPSPSPDPMTIGEESWAVAEETAQEVLNWIHPTLDSEEKRKDVIDYVQRLIRDSLGCEVFPYGSVPLKTYLPDGDIDLTALSSLNVEEILPQDVLAVLQEEEQNENAEYQVKDTQFIDAEVKLVKCLVQNIVVDISFNQLGGLCTLCFLEQVDRLVGRDHLFKRSILLVKAWCYYESRILGAHHGLISTYALETLVLYIFHLFHSSLNGPLMVLYRFLDYFSKFDWDNYCISLNGPVCKSNLPNIVVEMPDNGGNGMMLSEEFLRNCMEMFAVPSRGTETSSRTFPPKHLNIIDPLKECNNLGRSVHRGNFYRIRSAFKYGARKLGRILLSPRDKIADEIKDFYANTLERHGRKCGRDLQKPVLGFGAEFNLSSLSSTEVLSEDDILLKSSLGDFENDNIGVEDKCTSVFSDELNKYSMTVSWKVSEGCYLADGAAISGHRLLGDANDLSCSSSLMGANGSSDCLSNRSSCLSGHRISHFCPSKSCIENGNLQLGSFCRSDSSVGIDEKVVYDAMFEQRDFYASNTYPSCMDKFEDVCSKGSEISSPKTDTLETLSLDFRERDFDSLAGDAEPLNPLSDLSGDYDSHIRSLLYGQCIHGTTLSAPVGPNSPSSPSRYRSKKPWDTVRQSMPLRRNSFSQTNSNSVYIEPPLDAAGNSAPSGAALDSEEKHKARGTGTYFPNTNCFCRERRSPRGRLRNKTTGSYCQFQRHIRNNASSLVLSETSSSENGSYEVPNSRSSVPGHHKSGVCTQSHYYPGADTCINGFSNVPCRLEFGSLGNLPEILLSGSSHTRGSNPSLPVKGKILKSVQDTKERVAEQSFHLKNEDEFPPLSV